MSKTLTLKLPDEIAEVIEQFALKSGTAEEELALEWLARYAAKPHRELGQAELAAAWTRLRRHAGEVRSGDPRSADNVRMDEDLTREYGSPHQEVR